VAKPAIDLWRARIAPAALGLLFFLGCSEELYTVKLMAEHDLKCAEGHVTVTSDGTKTGYRAKGCGLTGDYICVEVPQTGTPFCSRGDAGPWNAEP
jgi:hypothetical protein